MASSKIHLNEYEILADLPRERDQCPRITLFGSNKILVIQQNIVFLYRGDILSRKLVYDEQVVDAFFTQFTNNCEDEATMKEPALVVLLKDVSYIYLDDGKSYTSRYPFMIKNGFSYENGAVLERDDTSAFALFTLQDPISQLGSISSSSTTSISASESLISFPESSSFSIAVNYDESNHTILFYHTKLLNCPTKLASKNNSIRRKPSQSIRRTSLTNNNETNETITDPEGIQMEKRRSTSHSDAMSIDRMTSYDFAAPSIPNHDLDSITSRKDAILTRIDSEKLPKNTDIKSFKIQTLRFDNKEVVIVMSPLINLFKIYIFSSITGSMYTPKLTNQIDLSGKYIDFTKTSIHGFILLLTPSNELILFNPVLSLSSSIFETRSKVKKIYNSVDSQVIVLSCENEILSINLIANPSLELVKSFLKNVNYLTNSYTSNYIWLIWLNAYSLTRDDWDSFILLILSILLPFSTNFEAIVPSNRVAELAKLVPQIHSSSKQDDFTLEDMAPNFVLALHLIREDLKLNTLSTNHYNNLSLLLTQLTTWMSWSETWYSYYGVDLNLIDRSIKFPKLQIVGSPPDLMNSLASLFEPNIVPYITFSQLAQENERIDEVVTPRTYYILKLFEAVISPDFTSQDVVSIISEYNITSEELDTYPLGVVIPLQEVIAYCQEHITNPNEQHNEYELIDRKDLGALQSSRPMKNVFHPSVELQTQTAQNRDMNQILNSINEQPDFQTPIETERFNVTKLIFSKDRSFYEITNILQTFKVQKAILEDKCSLSENQLLMKQKELALLVCLRTLSIPIGRSSVLYSSKVPLVTERFPIPKINFNTLIQPANTTVSLSKDEINKDQLQWGYFHNGASAGLTISRDAKGISGSWVVFNKPSTLSAQHGGFLLGLGLNGHLKSLEEWNIYNYLGPKHTFTSVGLLLGMSASLMRTMDVKLTKVLSVHVVALLPQGASDLIVSIPVQTAGLIGIGLLYLETQHRRMSEILLSQIKGKVIVEEKEISNESYKLAAGLALGYVNLGKGGDLTGLNDAHIVDKLLSMSTSMKDIQTDDSSDKAMAGATLSLALIYLKTNNENIAAKLKIPETEQLMDYVRPDLLMLRVLSKNLILWDSIGNTRGWVHSQIPTTLLETTLNQSITIENQNFYYIMAGACLSIGLRYASSNDLVARNTLLDLYDEISEELIQLNDGWGIEIEKYETKVVEAALFTVRNVLLISLSLIMAATGDLETFRRLRILHAEFSSTNSKNGYGKFMAINMALGFLFLGGGQYAFNVSSNFSVAALLTSIYPLFPISDTPDTDVHLQALRHFWSLAVELRCLVVRDVETFRPIKTPVKIDLKNGNSLDVEAPCLLPLLSSIKKIQTVSDDFFKVEIDSTDQLGEKLDLYVYRKNKFEVMKKSVELIISKINAKFEWENKSKKNPFVNLRIFETFNKFEVLSLLEDNDDDIVKSNIVDRQLELASLVKSPRNIDDLWNLKIIFSFYDRILSEKDTHYLSLEYVDELKIKLWVVANL